MTEANAHDAIMARLATVAEPCSIAMRAPTDIVAMGLVEDARLDARTVTVTLCLTDPACVHFRGLQLYIRDVLMPLDFVDAVEVVQTLDILWTPDRVAGAAA